MKKKMFIGISAVVLSASTFGLVQVFAQNDGGTENVNMFQSSEFATDNTKEKENQESTSSESESGNDNEKQSKDLAEIEGKRYVNDEGEKMIKTKGTPPINVEEFKESKKNAEEKLSDFIAKQSESFSEQSDDPRLKQTGYDEGFNYYLKAQELFEAKSKINVENASSQVQKDFENLFRMKAVIGHSQFVRTAHLNGQGKATEDVERSDQWDSTPEKMRQAYEYMKQIIHDLDVALNHDGEGETYGVTHTLNGDKVSEVESAFSGE